MEQKLRFNFKPVIFGWLMAMVSAHAASTNEVPKFDEVYDLLRTNLGAMSEADLNKAAVKGLLSEIPLHAALVTPGEKDGADDALAKSKIYDGSYAYFQIAGVAPGLDTKLQAAYHSLSEAGTNKIKIKGVILDLRFAGGTDYAAAAAVANCFLNSDQPLLDWGTGTARATKKETAITVPVATLINSQTSGAAEALAAVLREANEGLLIGGKTSGEACVFKEFPLSDGQKLRIATVPVKLGNGSTLAAGLVPDIAVDSNLADERVYMLDAYKPLHPSQPPQLSLSTTNLASVAPTNRPAHHRLNEAELVREHREGADLTDDFSDNPGSDDESAPVITDPALARALDLLKGLSIVQQGHPG